MSTTGMTPGTDFLARMVARSLGRGGQVAPRLPSLFESPQALAPEGEEPASLIQARAVRMDGPVGLPADTPDVPAAPAGRPAPPMAGANTIGARAQPLPEPAWRPAPVPSAPAWDAPPARPAQAAPDAGIFPAPSPGPRPGRSMADASPPRLDRVPVPRAPAPPAPTLLSARAGTPHAALKGPATATGIAGVVMPTARSEPDAHDGRGAVSRPGVLVAERAVLPLPSPSPHDAARGRHPPNSAMTSAAAPVITVSIGRVEVRAQPAAPARRPAAPVQAPPLSLDDYLKRNGGRS